MEKEIIFYDDPHNFDLTMWNEAGKVVHKQYALPDKPLEEILNKSKELMKSIDRATQDIEKIRNRGTLA